MPTASQFSAPIKKLQISLQAPEPENNTIKELPKSIGQTPQNLKQANVPKPKQTEQSAPKPEVITSQPISAEPQQPKVTVSATDLIQQAKTHTNVQISDEFTARTNNNKNETPWNTIPTARGPYTDVPYLASYDLAVDMNFYSEGYRGDIERFFDKVILKKTFTTKYGTKISCALAVLLVCGWK